jgi:hypothetical protein
MVRINLDRDEIALTTFRRKIHFDLKWQSAGGCGVAIEGR